MPVAQRNLASEVFFGLGRLGGEAVLVFFALSGFLVGGGVITRVRAKTFDLTRYAIERATRILIPLVPACLLTAIVTMLIMHRPLNGLDLLGNMVGLNEVLVPTLTYDKPLWSLAFEIWFYVMAGAIAAWITRGGILPLVATAAVAGLFMGVLGPECLIFWSFGSLASLTFDSTKKVWLAAFGLAVMITGVVSFQLGNGSKLFATVAVVPLTLAQGMVAMGFSLMLPWLCKPNTDAALGFIRRPARMLSAISYSLYLTHAPVNASLSLLLPKFYTIDASSFVAFTARMTICTLVATAFYFAFERQTGAVRRAVSGRLTAARSKALRPECLQ